MDDEPEAEVAVGNIFFGSNGYMVRQKMGYKTFLGKEQRPGPAAAANEDHFANFIRALRSRNRAELSAEIEEGAITCDLIHLANISYRLGRTIHFDPVKLQRKGDEQANRMFKREYRAPYVVPEKV